MSLSTSRSGIYVGRNAGTTVTRPAKMAWRTRPVTRKGRVSKRALAVREIIREVAGFSPLEQKMDELMRIGDAAKDKKATKLARAKLGTHKRAIQKREEMSAIITASKKRKE
jgi:large subunit ribosomal protein L36e